MVELPASIIGQVLDGVIATAIDLVHGGHVNQIDMREFDSLIPSELDSLDDSRRYKPSRSLS